MTNNTFNYRFSTLEKVLKELENLMPKKEKLEKNGLKVDINIKKSKYNYWNLKLKIYNEQSNKQETRVFKDEALVDERG